MHELSIAQDLVELVEASLASSAPQARVTSVRVRIGVLSGVVPAALASAWPAATRKTAIAGAQLVVEEVQLAIWCDVCQREQELGGPGRLVCPACGTRSGQIVRGRELEIASVEVIDAASDH